jgi:hypothetical protein
MKREKKEFFLTKIKKIKSRKIERPKRTQKRRRRRKEKHNKKKRKEKRGGFSFFFPFLGCSSFLLTPPLPSFPLPHIFFLTKQKKQ